MKSTLTKPRIWLAIALCHLLLVGFGAAHLKFWNWGTAGQWLDRYGMLSGAGSTYPFFAPVVGTSIRAEFDLFDSQKRRIGTDNLMASASREMGLRLSNIVEIIDEDINNRETRRLLATSWAGKMFARHPEAASLTLRVETYDLPSMAEYREGKRYDWESLYRATFNRGRSKSRVAAN